MKRVAVTGLGAVTPLGNTAPATWAAAVEGTSGIDWIRSFDASEFPVRVAAEVKAFDPTTVASPKEARRLDRPAAEIAARVIARGLDAQTALRAEIDAAVADADAGVFVSAEAMHAWMETWEPGTPPLGD